MALKRTEEAFAMWVEMPGNVDGFFRVMEEVEGTAKMAFRNACMEVRVPYTLMYRYVHEDVELKARYDSFLAAKADLLVQEALEDVGEAVDKDSAAVAKVKSDVKLRVAEKWDRERYGERVQIDRAPEAPGGDAALLGFASELLRLVRKEEPRVVEVEQEALEAPAAGDGPI